MEFVFKDKEISQMITETLEKFSEKKLDNDFFNSYLELLDLNEIDQMIHNYNMDIDMFLTTEQLLFISKKYEEYTNCYIDFIINNQLLHQSKAKEVISTFMDNSFHRYNCQLDEINIIDNINLVKKFLKHFDLELYELFKYLLSNNRVWIMDNSKYMFCGSCYNINNKAYISCLNTNNLNVALTLVHELGHVCDIYNKKNFNFNDLFVELKPHYIEDIFFNYLIENNIYIDDALLFQNKSYYDLYNYFLSLFILTKLHQIDCSISTNTQEVKEIIANESFIPKKSSNMIDEYLSISGVLCYGYGNLLGLNYFDKYKGDMNKAKEFLKQNMKGNNPLNYLENENYLGKQLVLNNERIKKRI